MHPKSPDDRDKATAKATGNRKVDMVPLREVQPLTGCVRGGVTALACKRDYPVVVDETTELHDDLRAVGGRVSDMARQG